MKINFSHLEHWHLKKLLDTIMLVVCKYLVGRSCCQGDGQRHTKKLNF